MSLKKEVDELKDIMHGMLQKMKEQQVVLRSQQMKLQTVVVMVILKVKNLNGCMIQHYL